MKNLSILGSTGSIGRNTLKIVEMFPERFSVKVLAAKTSIRLLADQIERFRPELTVVFDEDTALKLRGLLLPGCRTEIHCGADGYRSAAVYESVDMVVTAMVGAAGLMPTLAAIDAGKDIALANKETLVMAGEVVMKRAAAKGVSILPIDSEHSAIFQCLAGNRIEDMKKILLTASGGPFFKLPVEQFDHIKPEDALKHPTWEMGKKISIDSATLMNKGLEVIEAKWLFGVSSDKIDIVIHPQSVIHSMVSYKDGSIIAQLGIPDMKAAIAYAISYPDRLPLEQALPDFGSLGAFTFADPDMEKFPCLGFAFAACKKGGTMPAVLNAANEIAVEVFLDALIPFVRIPEIIGKTMETHSVVANPELSAIVEADEWARKTARKLVGKIIEQQG